MAPEEVPAALAEMHAATAPGDVVTFELVGEAVGLDTVRQADVVVGAGFALEAIEHDRARRLLVLRRLRSLADTVGAGMRVLSCGLNPSLYSADAAVGYSRPGNRFWPAALAAGVVSVDRDPMRALVDDGVGMTDLVKRATRRATELTREEYEAGHARLERLCGWLEPAVVVMVGLTGWRAAVDGDAVAGWQSAPIGGRPVYLMPSTSGLNAHTSLDGFVEHLTAAMAGP